jgi:hypothetical protein
LQIDSQPELAAISELLARIRGLLPARVFAVLWLRFTEGWTLTEAGERRRRLPHFPEPVDDFLSRK